LNPGITITVSSNNGGTFSKTSLTLAAGANSEDSFTFTPVANSVTTLTFARTGGGQAPPQKKIYSITDPVAHAATNLTDAANTLLAKYSAAKWVAADSYTDYFDGVPSPNGGVCRAIQDSGFMSEPHNPFGMINFFNVDAPFQGPGWAAASVVEEASGARYINVGAGVRGLMARKRRPNQLADAGNPTPEPNPLNRMKYKLSDAHFYIATIRIHAAGASGAVLNSNEVEGSTRSELRLVAGVPHFVVRDNNYVEQVIVSGGGAISSNAAHTITATSKTGGQRLRVNRIQRATGTLTPGAGEFNSMHLGGNFDNHWPNEPFPGGIYNGIIGVGDPTDAELNVIEQYSYSLSQVGAGTPPPPPGPAPAPGPASAPFYPFGSRLDSYQYGIQPTGVTNAQKDTAVQTNYNGWKAARLVARNDIVSGGYVVTFTNSQWPNKYVVSEGMGYGMLITVCMAGYDPNAKTYFDGLFKVARARYSTGVVTSGQPAEQRSLGYYLMGWVLRQDGTYNLDLGGNWNALDADLDIAMALLMAHRQWGSTGAINYLQEGKNTIAAMKAFSYQANGTSRGVAAGDVSRPSDYMINFYRHFAVVMNDSWWSTQAINAAWYQVNRMQTVYSPAAGMVPDFVANTNGARSPGQDSYPSPGGIGDGTDTEMFYFANSQRCPMRWGSDYIFSGDNNWRSATNKIVSHMKTDTGGDPTKMPTGYALSGAVSGHAAIYRPWPNWVPKDMLGCAMVGMMVDSSHQAFLNASWTYCAANPSTLYYEAELLLLSMIIVSGNWWQPLIPTQAPSPAPTPAPGPTPAPAPALPFMSGVNVHEGGASTAENTQIASILHQRNIKKIRMDIYADYPLVRDLCEKHRGNGGKVEGIIFTTYHQDNTIYPSGQWATIEADAYNQTYAVVDSMKDIIQDWELMNEINIRAPMLADVAFNSAETSTAPFLASDAYVAFVPIIRGMADAIHDVGIASGIQMRTILGLAGRDFGMLQFFIDGGVDVDVIGWHNYPWNFHGSVRTDTWYGAGGAYTRLGAFNRPVTLNEFNAGEIYDPPDYENTENATNTELGFSSNIKHMRDLMLVTECDIESVVWYELLDEPLKSPPESHFGLMYSLTSPKISLFIATAFAGGTLSTAERAELTSRGMTNAEIDAMQPGGAPPPPSGEQILIDHFAAGKVGSWLDPDPISRFHTFHSSGVAPLAYPALVGRWLSRGSAGTDWREQLNEERIEAHIISGLACAFMYADSELLGVGGSTTGFYACLALNATSYRGTYLADMTTPTANNGIRLYYDGDDRRCHFSIGNGSSRIVCSSHQIGALYTSMGFGVVEAWFDGTNIGCRFNKGTAGTAAATVLAAGSATMHMAALAAANDEALMQVYHGVVFKNFCPTLADRDAIATECGARAGLTI